MALIPSAALYSLPASRNPPVAHRQSNFHILPVARKPLIVHQLAKYHRLAVCQNSSPESLATSIQEKPPIAHRQSNYQPPAWYKRFIESLDGDHLESEAYNRIKIGELKEEVKNMFIYANNPLQKMNLVDAIERLGLAYHFDKEINSTLQQVYDDDNEDFGDNLQATALRFRLLRQHGYFVSCDVFEKFKDEEANFKQSLVSDVRGLLSLYEASHCGIHGEDILDNSLTFTTQELKSMASHLDPNLARRVQQSLELPPQRRLPRLEVRHFISFYEDDESRNDVLLELAKMDFNLLLNMHRREINEVFRWLKELELAEKFHHSRDRVIDCYIWAMGLNFLPEFSTGRIALAKLINSILLIDDAYDTLCTIEEMELFTDAIDRWDIRAIDQLPEYLRLPYVNFYNVVNDMKHMSMKHRENNASYYIKKMVQEYCKASLHEARWFHDGYVPSMDEYMSTSLTTAAGSIVLPAAALAMEDMIDKEGLDYIVRESKLPKLVNSIARLLDDISSSKVELARGDSACSIHCCMKQYGFSQEEAKMHIKSLVAEAWKDINQELLNPIPLPRSLVNGIITFGKLSSIFFLEGNDVFGNPQNWTRDKYHSMLFEPIPM